MKSRYFSKSRRDIRNIISFAMQKGTLVNLVSYYYWMLVTGIGQARAETLHGGKEESVRQDQQDLHEALLLFPPLSQFHPSGAASSPEDLHAGGEALQAGGPPGWRPLRGGTRKPRRDLVDRACPVEFRRTIQPG
jgi:hypothetical protein